VAINLNGHHWNAASEVVRFPLFLHGAAPVQAAYMGYPGPNGARFLHHTYVDALVAPVRRAAASFTERLALLPHSYYLSDYAASHRALLEPATPSADALPRSTPLLCSLNQLPKLDPALFATWLNALSRAAASPGPPARLWLLRFPLTAIANLRAEAAAHASAVPAAAMIDLPTVAYEARPVYVVRVVCAWCARGVRMVSAWCAGAPAPRGALRPLRRLEAVQRAHLRHGRAVGRHAPPHAAPHNIGLPQHRVASLTHGCSLCACAWAWARARACARAWAYGHVHVHVRVVAGTPLISLPGDPQPARVALSLLLAVGLPSLVVHSLRGYEEQVVHLTAAAGGGHRGGARLGGPRGLLGST